MGSKSFDVFKKIGYVLLIVLVFSPLSFLVSNTLTNNFFVTEETQDCYLQYARFNASESEHAAVLAQQQACTQQNQDIYDRQGTVSFIVISVINIIVIGLLLLVRTRLHGIISYSLFAAAGLNTIIIVIRYNTIKSLVGVILGSVLFILILSFINKSLHKEQ